MGLVRSEGFITNSVRLSQDSTDKEIAQFASSLINMARESGCVHCTPSVVYVGMEGRTASCEVCLKRALRSWMEEK